MAAVCVLEMLTDDITLSVLDCISSYASEGKVGSVGMGMIGAEIVV
jgi:hypothetical protein